MGFSLPQNCSWRKIPHTPHSKDTPEHTSQCCLLRAHWEGPESCWPQPHHPLSGESVGRAGASYSAVPQVRGIASHS